MEIIFDLSFLQGKIKDHLIN